MTSNPVSNVNESVLRDRKFAKPDRFDEHISNTLSELMEDMQDQKKKLKKTASANLTEEIQKTEIELKNTVTEKKDADSNSNSNNNSNTPGDKAELSSFQWGTDKDGEPQIRTEESAPILTNVDLKNKGLKILKDIGHNIDFLSKLPQLKQSFMQTMVQSRSHNLFLSKFAKFKVGLLGQVMSAMGVKPEEIEQLKKEAIDGAVKENKELMAENQYNILMIELVHGKRRKSRRYLMMFDEIQTQLVTQMNYLDQPGYWNKVSLLELKIIQCKRIREELKREKESLMYQCEYRGVNIIEHKI